MLGISSFFKTFYQTYLKIAVLKLNFLLACFFSKLNYEPNPIFTLPEFIKDKFLLLKSVSFLYFITDFSYFTLSKTNNN